VDSADQDKRGSDYTIGRHPSSRSQQQSHTAAISSSSSSGLSIHPASMNRGRPMTPTNTSRGPTSESHDTHGHELSVSPEVRREDQIHRRSFPSASSPPLLSPLRHQLHNSSDPEFSPPMGVLSSRQAHVGPRDTSAQKAASLHHHSPSAFHSSHQLAPGDHPAVSHAHSSSQYSFHSKPDPVSQSQSKSPNQFGAAISTEKKSGKENFLFVGLLTCTHLWLKNASLIQYFHLMTILSNACY